MKNIVDKTNWEEEYSQFRKMTHDQRETAYPIMEKAMELYKITAMEILSSRRGSDLVDARKYVIRILRVDHKWPLPEIAKALNKEDHSTIYHHTKKMGIK